MPFSPSVADCEPSSTEKRQAKFRNFDLPISPAHDIKVVFNINTLEQNFQTISAKEIPETPGGEFSDLSELTGSNKPTIDANFCRSNVIQEANQS